MDVNQPVFIRSLAKPGAGVFAMLFTLDSIGRAMVSTALSLQAYTLYQGEFGVDQSRPWVSATFMITSLASLVFNLISPVFIQHLKRRWFYVAGMVVAILGVLLLATGTLPGQVAGMICRALSAAACRIALLLYMMDYIPRHQLVKSEPLRLFTSCLAWGLGPWIGVRLYESHGMIGPALISTLSYIGLIGYFLYLRMHDDPALVSAGNAVRQFSNPLRNVLYFVRQKRLMLSWTIAFGRSCWWSMFFIYPALYMTDHHVDPEWAGRLVGAGNFMLVTAPVISLVAQRVGIRAPLVYGLLGGGVLTLSIALFYDNPLIVCLLLFLGAACIVVLDALGNIPFMRFVRPAERSQMSPVFQTYIDLSDLLPQMIYTLLLIHFDFRAVFIASGLLTIATGVVASYLPKRL